MTKLQTRPELLKAMEDAAKKPLTSEQIFRQRVSFIMGSIRPDSGVTRSRIEDVLERQEGKPIDPVRAYGE